MNGIDRWVTYLLDHKGQLIEMHQTGWLRAFNKAKYAVNRVKSLNKLTGI